MAFSFHIGTKWCHDFPKLAKESGFYFNTRRSRSYIDLDYIDSLSIERVIKERDFVTVDENITNIINYNLESQYDIKILDSNFVKVFQLAQLAVEYLLYCKQYLDQSVIILKDELKLKIENNHKLRKEITALEEIIKNLKDKAKERNRMVETKIGDSNGKIHKCPHCPKSFISTIFVKAHVARRHPYITDLSVETSPVHDHYRAETEKLYNEIKMLKERLNQAEKVIRNESDRTSSIIKLENKDKENDSESDTIKYNVNKFALIEKQQIKNSKEINDLKSLLLDEIYNFRHKDESFCKVHDNVPEINVKLLISQQEKEIEKLRNQLLEKLTPDIEKMHEKLKSREDYWRSQIQQMDQQHHTNIEKLTAELKLTRQAAELLKAEYEHKVSALEKQSKDQSNILLEQTKRLSSLSCDMRNSQVQTDLSRYYNDITTENVSKSTIIEHSPITHFQNTNIVNKVDVNRITVENINSPSKQKLQIEPVMVASKVSQNHYEEKGTNEEGISKINVELPADKSKNEHEINPKPMFLQEHCKNGSFEEHSNLDSPLSISNGKAEIMELSLENVYSIDRKINAEGHRAPKHLYTAETESSETSSSVISTTSESETESVSGIINNKKNSVYISKNQTIPSLSKSMKISQHNVVDLEKVKKNVLEKFQKKLRDIGIDPEWNEIPQASYKQKVKIIQHHQSINSKKFLKYSEIKRNALKEILQRISVHYNILHQSKLLKSSTLDKLVTNVKSKAIKAFSIPKNYVSQKKLYMNVEGEEKNTNEVFKAPRKSLILSKEKNEHVSKNINEHNVISRTENWSNVRDSQKSETLELTPNINENDNPEESSSKMRKFSNRELHKTSTPKQQNSISFLKPQNITERSITTPKHNKGALKSTTVSVISSAKKKVFFDLDDNKNEEMSSLSQQIELNDSDWNVSSISDEKGQVLQKKKSLSANNIVFKTTQTEKIAEISKKIEEQLRASRKKPIGAIEISFPLTYISEKRNKEENLDNKDAQDNYLSSVSISNSSLEHSSPKLLENLKNSGIKLPLPTPRGIRKQEFSSAELKKALPITNDSNLDADIDDILQAE